MTSPHSLWTLVEKEMSLLSIGSTHYTGVSLRKTLGPVAREVLLPALREAVETGADIRRVVAAAGEEWSVRVDALIAPMTREVVGAHGVFVPHGRGWPPKPAVGATEWLVSPTGAAPIRSYWDEGMFELYEFDVPWYTDAPVQAGWPAPQWFNHVLVPEDRARMKVSLDEVVQSVTPQLHTLTYGIITGLGGGRPGRKQLRLAGRALQQEAGGDILLQGLMHEVAGPLEDYLPEIAPARTDDFVRAIFDVSSEALCAVDTHFMDIYMTSASWEAAGLAPVDNGSLLKLVHPEDGPAFGAYLIAAAANRSPTQNAPLVRIRTSDGAWGSFSVLAAGVSSGSEERRYAVCRVAPA